MNQPVSPEAEKRAKATRYRRKSRPRWEMLAELWLKHPHKPLHWYAQRVKMDHTSVLYALRQMGLYDSEAQKQARLDDAKRLDDIHARHEAERRAAREAQQTKLQRTWAERKADQRTAKLVRDRAYYTPSPQQQAVIARVAAIKAQLSAGIGPDVVAERFGVSRRYVRDIQAGRRWASVEPERKAAA
jgi:hypothetical protein